jgi:hypothetical protein
LATGAFHGASITKIDIPDTVKTIGEYAFAYSKLIKGMKSGVVRITAELYGKIYTCTVTVN